MTRFHLEIPAPSQANVLQAVFARRRGSLELVRARPEAQTTLLQSRTLWVRFTEPLQPRELVRLEFQGSGEELRRISHEFRLISEAEWVSTEGDLRKLRFLIPETPKAEIFQWRASRATGDFAVEKMFFNAFDDATWEVDADQTALLPLIQQLLRARQQGDPVAALLDLADPAALQRFSDHFKDSALATFGDPLTNAQSLEDAFDRFARGELSLLDASDLPTEPAFGEYKALACQPNSTYYFYFAEFASLCIHHGKDPALWQELLATFVQSQEALFEAYEDGGGDSISHGQLLGGKWPPAVPTAVDDLHQERAAFRSGDWATMPDAVRQNFALQFVTLP